MKKGIKKLSPSMKLVEKAICKQLKFDFDNKEVIKQEVPLQKLKIKGIADIAKLCRRMRRSKLLNYNWNKDRFDKESQFVSITAKGFQLLNN